jgi:hypothetical protein
MKLQEKLIFLHIPKTAGTSLRKIIETEYPGEECLWLYYPAPYQPAVLETIQALLPAAKMLYGHVSFGIHQLLGIEGKYLTFLRNPIDRVISLYNHHARDPDMLYYTTIQDGMTLLDMLEGEITPETNNHIVRILTCNGQLEMLDDTSALQQAIENINQYFSFVGLMEQFRESVIRLGQQLGWQTPLEIPYLNEDPTKTRQTIDAQTQAALERYNRLDMLLYQHVSRC